MNKKRMMTVSCGVANHCIYAHDLADKNNAYPVTQPAICAVRDYMVDDIKKGENSVGYMWNRADGSKVKLICIVEGK